jgi:hypothetical protein
MTELEDLSGALRGQLRAMVTDLNPSEELWAKIDAIPETEARPRLRERLTRRRLALTLPLPVAAIAASAALVFGGAAPSASFGNGVTWLPNGDLTIQQIVLTHPARANAVLRRAHFPMVVIPMTTSCPYHRFTYNVEPVHPPAVGFYTRPQTIDRRYVAVQAARLLAPNKLLVAGMANVAVDHVPPCASSRGQAANAARRLSGAALPKMG